MSYTKIDSSGDALPITATSWAMVRDNITGLIWENKTDDGSIHDKDNTYAWDDASSEFIAELNTTKFGGYSDWKLATLKELSSIVDYSIYSSGSTIDRIYFKNIIAGAYWTNTSRAAYPSDVAYIINFFNGDDGSVNKIKKNYVMAVRGDSVALEDYDHLFINDQIIADTLTGLMWQRAGDDTKKNWKDAILYCENLELGGYKDWRLPTIKELRTIIDYNSYSPCLDQSIFSNTYYKEQEDSKIYLYWSSTTYAKNVQYAWCMDFKDGYDHNISYQAEGYASNNKTDFNYVRAVRGGYYDQLYEAGKQACINDPLSCGIGKYLIFSNNAIPVLESGSSVNVYGNNEINKITLKSGASAKLINFSGNNEVTVQADSTLFNVSRSGATVTFKDSNGTVLIIPATKTAQTIIFDNNVKLILVIKSNQVMLGEQVVSLTSSPIQ